MNNVMALQIFLRKENKIMCVKLAFVRGICTDWTVAQHKMKRLGNTAIYHTRSYHKIPFQSLLSDYNVDYTKNTRSPYTLFYANLSTIFNHSP